MDNNKDIVDVEYQEIEDGIYLTAPQVAQKINDADSRVRHWGDVFGDLIGIERVNGRKRYKESDVSKFAFIKDLLDNKNFTHEQARVYLSKHGFQYAEFKSDLIDPKDPLGFQALASALSVEVDNKLKQFANELISNISNQLTEHLISQKQMNLETKAEIESAVDEIVSEKLNQSLQEFKSTLDTKEQEATKRDAEMIEYLKQHMEQRKKENELQLQQQKKGFFSRVFGK